MGRLLQVEAETRPPTPKKRQLQAQGVLPSGVGRGLRGKTSTLQYYQELGDGNCGISDRATPQRRQRDSELNPEARRRYRHSPRRLQFEVCDWRKPRRRTSGSARMLRTSRRITACANTSATRDACSGPDRPRRRTATWDQELPRRGWFSGLRAWQCQSPSRKL